MAVVLEDGSVYLVSNFESKFWFNADLTLSTIAACQLGSSSMNLSERPLDFLLGIGQFNGIVAYQDGKRIFMHELSDWAHQLSVSRLIAPAGTTLPDKDFLAVATADNALEVLELTLLD